MYYLERRQNEKFHDWARRVYDRHQKVRTEIIENINDEATWYIDRIMVSNWYNRPGYNTDQILIAEKKAYQKIKRKYPFTKNFIDISNYPRSILTVKRYTVNIKEYELVKELKPYSRKCDYCGYRTRIDNLFSDVCKKCRTVNCIKCEKTIYRDIFFLNFNIIFNARMSDILPENGFQTYIKSKNNISYRKWCNCCIKVDLGARVIQYFWKISKRTGVIK